MLGHVQEVAALLNEVLSITAQELSSRYLAKYGLAFFLNEVLSITAQE